MAQHQLYLIILAVIVIGLAIIYGIGLFRNSSISFNKDNIMNDLKSVAGYAYGYKLLPIPLGGGGRYYTGYTLPSKFTNNENATYSLLTSPNSITFTAVSKLGYGTITAVLDSSGVLSHFIFTGDFE
ncbi:MAG: hypothetical protein HY707_11115 [Ignavibacteriae bacterium]|nr:hypothetical protein [Ignavibacteriota bacterium]